MARFGTYVNCWTRHKMLIYVAFADVGRLFRDGAHVKQTMNLTNTVFDENRLVGC